MKTTLMLGEPADGGWTVERYRREYRGTMTNVARVLRARLRFPR